MNSLKLLDDVIADLEAKLNLQPGEDPTNRLKTTTTTASASNNSSTNSADKGTNDENRRGSKKETKKKEKKGAGSGGSKTAASSSAAAASGGTDLPDICKLEFKVGEIVKVWVHPEADKLYCEEINVGEGTNRQIASGLRPHFTEAQMLGQRLLVVSNLKPKNLVGFKSHGMVLCAASSDSSGDGERVEFVEPPVGAAIGEVVTFEGLPPPQPSAPAQVEKKKIWQAAAAGMKTTDDCCAAWNGHVFMTSVGPCRTKTIASGPMR